MPFLVSCLKYQECARNWRSIICSTSNATLSNEVHLEQHTAVVSNALCGGRAQSCESPLLVAAAAGSVALPTLLKMAAIMAAQGQDFRTGEQLPMELELGREFVFHSVFACPVRCPVASSVPFALSLLSFGASAVRRCRRALQASSAASVCVPR